MTIYTFTWVGILFMFVVMLAVFALAKEGPFEFLQKNHGTQESEKTK